MSVSADFSSDIFNKDLPQSSLIIDRSNSRSGAKFHNVPRTLFDEIGREFNDHDDLFSWKALVRRLREENASLLSTIQSTRDELSQLLNDKTRLEDIVTSQEDTIHSLQNQLDSIMIEREQQKQQVEAAAAAVMTGNDEIDQYQLKKKEEDTEQLDGVLHQQEHARLNNLFERKAQLIEQQRDNEKEKDNISPLSPFPTYHTEQRQRERSEHNSSTDRLLVAVHEAQDGYAIERERRIELVFQKRYLMLVNKSLESCESQTLEYLKELGIPHNIRQPSLSPTSKWRACFNAVIAVYRLRKLISGENE
ncbi:hypothetical protein INT45_005411 [Circinella minor]|uniref:Pericentrin/AKAP-450 centrosomal targeting domain-containing protein n=1 Tax=Circinella minor TaxID=1195481 RepID=A0A8H7RTZ5_9FUNG|nr:hypothetical protein INT45_005411 [Circinella minor]